MVRDKKTADQMWEWAHHRPVSCEEAIKHWELSVGIKNGWVEFMRRNHEHNKKRLRAQGWTLSEGTHGSWVRKN